MRDINFRVWDDYDGVMIDTLTLSSIHKYIYDDEDLENDIMQYTGVKDKNDKRIYECDIVKVMDIYIGVVKYDYGGYYFSSKNSTLNDGWINMFSSEYLEVIGNIYENHELVAEHE